jgi:hypothetical protein
MEGKGGFNVMHVCTSSFVLWLALGLARMWYSIKLDCPREGTGRVSISCQFNFNLLYLHLSREIEDRQERERDRADRNSNCAA